MPFLSCKQESERRLAPSPEGLEAAGTRGSDRERGGGAEPTGEALPWAAAGTGPNSTRPCSPIQCGRNFREAGWGGCFRARSTERGSSDKRSWWPG